MNILLIGLGGMGKNHFRVLSQLDQVKKIFLHDKDNALMNEHTIEGRVEAVSTLKKFFNSGEYKKIEGVIIAAPTSTHLEIFKNVIKFNKPVFIEKPVAGSLIDAQEIHSLAQEYKMMVMIGHIERYNPTIVCLKKILKNNSIGSVLYINTIRVGGSPINKVKAGGAIFDLAVHDFDILNFIFDQPLEFIFAHGIKAESTPSATIALKSGSIHCDVHVNWITPVKSRKITITGETGMLIADLINQEIRFFPSNDKLIDQENNQSFVSFYEFTEISKDSNSYMLNIEKNEPLKAELMDFLQFCKFSSAKEGLPLLEDGLRAVELAELSEKNII
ncbi:Gfo/Idh/MocA family oxidoreductase [Gammaproteobacteria bacterium]|nr:Gfo/Idh/MocA family oxidoreductase [Gammaproteobacteria bacterium]